jgi:hypothetical protein
MIVIDGRQSGLEIKNFQNLEQLFNKVVEEGLLTDRVVTDVLVNDEPFSEIYPNQSEDIDVHEVASVEIRTIASEQMAINITGELYKVVKLMGDGAKGVADLFRQADDAEALEMYQDLLDVTRDFLNMIGVLHDGFKMSVGEDFRKASETLSSLFTEMSEVLENEDWILLADLLEYEFLPTVEQWKVVITRLRDELGADSKG